MAINAVNNDPTVLRDFTLSLTALDGQCKADAVMQSFIDYIRMTNYDNMIGILGKIFEHFESIFSDNLYSTRPCMLGHRRALGWCSKALQDCHHQLQRRRLQLLR
jgi:hypothetical protein